MASSYEMNELIRAAICNVKNEFSGQENTCELLSRVKDVMAMDEVEYKIANVKGSTSKFKANIEVNFKDEEDINTFIKRYGIKNNETLRISKTKKDGTAVVKYFRCHHNTRHKATRVPNEVLAKEPSKRFKNTNCPFSLIVRVGKNPEAVNFCSSIDIEWSHNHSVESLHSLSFKDMPASVVSLVKEMFARGLLPGAAYREMMRQLRSECNDDLDYHRRLSDRSQAPRRKDFNNIYTEFKKECFGTGNLSEMFSTLKERVKSLKEKDQDYTIECQEFDESIDQPFTLVIITPLMKRVHRMVYISILNTRYA